MKSFDLIVIGSGAGLNAAVGAAEQGLKVAIIEENAMGGTCLNRGCVPSKIIINSAEVAETIHRASEFGLVASLQKVNLKQIINRSNSVIDPESESIEKNVRSDGNLTLFKGRGRFISKYAVEVNGEKITGKKIVIAAGARPSIPAIPGLDKVPYLTSTEALRLKTLPKSMIIIGGGYIGAELGFFYAELGTKITILQRSKLLLSREDEEIASLITGLWKKKYDVLTDAEIVKVERKGKEISVTIKQGNSTKKISAEKLLIAAGVTPNSDTLDIKKAGIRANEKGFISVDRFLETNVKNIFALGDITGKYMFRHSANLEAEYVLNNILREKKAVDYYPMPHAVFTSPQIAGVGLTEQEAREQKIKYVIGREYYRNTAKGIALGEKHGFVKLIVDKKTKEILGCHIIGPEASLLLHEVVVAMKAGKNKALDLLRDTVHVHPSLNEVVQRAALNVQL
ncbi:MAG: dihydrolipoyl dehydrogenase [Nanoarchaeota archaeon]